MDDYSDEMETFDEPVVDPIRWERLLVWAEYDSSVWARSVQWYPLGPEGGPQHSPKLAEVQAAREDYDATLEPDDDGKLGHLTGVVLGNYTYDTDAWLSYHSKPPPQEEDGYPKLEKALYYTANYLRWQVYRVKLALAYGKAVGHKSTMLVWNQDY